MALLESAFLDIDPPRPRAVDTLMRALLYLARQRGRPVSEAELRSVAALRDGPLNAGSFLAAARRLGFDARATRLRREINQCF